MRPPDKYPVAQQRKARLSYLSGHLAEFFASLVLMIKGYRIAEKRFKTPQGEIDLIAIKSNLLVFIEVKFRKQRNDAIESITRRTRRRIETAAQIYLARHPEHSAKHMRFDAFLLYRFGLDHLKQAWRVGD